MRRARRRPVKHCEGNLHFYDSISRILFMGDLAVSMPSGTEARKPVVNLAAHIPRLEAFHRRYMVSNKILRLWMQMARQLDVQMLVPQHGAPILGQRAVEDFYRWIEHRECGIDVFDPGHYQIPAARIDPVTRRMRSAPDPVAVS